MKQMLLKVYIIFRLSHSHNEQSNHHELRLSRRRSSGGHLFRQSQSHSVAADQCSRCRSSGDWCPVRFVYVQQTGSSGVEVNTNSIFGLFIYQLIKFVFRRSDSPPPLPPHGAEYRPPVPPHRNVGVTANNKVRNNLLLIYISYVEFHTK